MSRTGTLSAPPMARSFGKAPARRPQPPKAPPRVTGPSGPSQNEPPPGPPSALALPMMLLIALTVVMFTASQSPPPPAWAPKPAVVEAPQPPARKIIWQEDFNGATLDRTRWDVQVSDPNDPGNTAFPPTYFAESQVSLRDGRLVLSTIRDGPGRYLSGLVETRGLHSWQTGRFEARIKTPPGKGSGMAFWMLPDVKQLEPWPQMGELDIVESLGREPQLAMGTLHYPKKPFSGGDFASPNPLSSEFHTYALEWTPEAFYWFADGKCYFKATHGTPEKQEFPFNRPFFLILSSTAGGTWPGAVPRDAVFPMEMEVDWVRVYEPQPMVEEPVCQNRYPAGYTPWESER
ncbi:MAG: glycoside hydrolase family 16 protein [Alphaproteobacteria bacterium]|nr:glycoside hydrolase family 16 protein [Alphaproteobacteria bacterium]